MFTKHMQIKQEHYFKKGAALQISYIKIHCGKKKCTVVIMRNMNTFLVPFLLLDFGNKCTYDVQGILKVFKDI